MSEKNPTIAQIPESNEHVLISNPNGNTSIGHLSNSNPYMELSEETNTTNTQNLNDYPGNRSIFIITDNGTTLRRISTEFSERAFILEKNGENCTFL